MGQGLYMWKNMKMLSKCDNYKYVYVWRCGISVCVCMHVYMCICVYVFMCVCGDVWRSVYMHVSVNGCKCCICVYMCGCVDVCVCVYVWRCVEMCGFACI